MGHTDRPTIPSQEELQTLPADGGERWNRLVFEQSPYLLQHAANPVDWHPWGDEALSKAKNLDKPIFLSIGYATCHWCHVMEHEAFEDQEVAELINRHFVPIKVDREERPDIDQIYMTACQALTGHGGWPLNCFLTPEGTVFYAGTYFPKFGHHPAQPGIMDLFPAIARAWKQQRADIVEKASELNQHLDKMNVSQPSQGLATDIDQKAFTIFQESFDPEHGGFGDAPKFPTPHQFLFLLRYWHRDGDEEALAMVEKSLKAMRLGGVFDHVGLGFHRYSTDKTWLLPHFEKMLYDQAMLIMVYSETYAATGDIFYKQVAEEIIEYVLTRMQHPEGGFFSAEDADSEGVEGKFYVWTYQELASVLSQNECQWFCSQFNIDKNGNFADEATGEVTGANIPHLKAAQAELVKQTGTSATEWETKWRHIRQKLYQCREQRVPPFKDDKVLTDWNGLMIAALARAALLLDNNRYLLEAQKAYRFVVSYLTDDQGRLTKRFRNGHAGLQAHLNDYAFMIWAALELYQASLESEYLEQAATWQNTALELFWDDQNGGFFFTSSDTDLVLRPKDNYDSAIPSGNSFMARNLVQLYHLTGQGRWQQYFEKLTQAAADQVNRYPAGSSMLLISNDLQRGPVQNLVFAGQSLSASVLQPIKQQFMPLTVWLAVSEENKQKMNGLAPFTEHYTNEEPLSLYLCENFTCAQPVHGYELVKESLQKLTGDK